VQRDRLTRGEQQWPSLPDRDVRLCTTTGAVAVSPAGPVTLMVPCPGVRATTTPLGSTLAIAGTSDVHVTGTGAAGPPSSRNGRTDARACSDGRRYTAVGSTRSATAGPVPGGCPAAGSGAGAAGAAAAAGGAVPVTCTAATPFRDPAIASTIATPGAPRHRPIVVHAST
jgi:hypothetical protein